MLTDTLQLSEPSQRCHGPIPVLTIDTTLAQQKDLLFENPAPDSGVSFSLEKELDSNPTASSMAPTPDPLREAFSRRFVIGKEKISNQRFAHFLPGGLMGSSIGVLEPTFSSSASTLRGTPRSELNMNLVALDLMHSMDPDRQKRSNPPVIGIGSSPTTTEKKEGGAETKGRSATKIQATFRGFLLRKKLIALYEEHISALEHRLRNQISGSGGPEPLATSSASAVLTQKDLETFEQERGFGTHTERDDLRSKLDECQQALSMANWRVQDLSQELERTKENCAKLHSSLTLANRSSKDLSSHLAIASRALDAQTSRSAALSATLSSIRQSLPDDHPLASSSEASEPHGPLATAQHELETERVRCLLKTGECEELRMQVMGLKREIENERNLGPVRPEEFRRGVATNPEPIGSWGSVNVMQRPGAGPMGSKNKGAGYRATLDGDGRIGMCIGGGGSSTTGNATAAARRLTGGTASSSREQDLNPDWQLLIEKIVKTNDQQSSLFLQQRLKTACQDVKQAIMDVILPHSLALMKNKFGNFLMQRCFEYGTRVQTSALASTMRGNVLSLALDPFGCHVAQKALDNVDEDVKASMVSEMLVRRIPETIIHRFASHVWQRVFEIRWTGAAGAPAVMNYVHGALQATWHQVAIEENGSLVVQNIFENCSEAEKRPVLHEILDHAPRIARGEFGNWVIQHILEHGSPADRRRIIRIILDDLPQIGTDQYSSKVVEKALKTSTRSEVQEIADRLCRIDPPESYPVSFELDPPALHRGNPFNTVSDPSSNSRGELVPLLALVADQYGNYVVQHLLHVAPAEQRERVAQWIRPHLSALRASKYGQKVAQIVERMSRSVDRAGHVAMHNPPLNQQQHPLHPALLANAGPMSTGYTGASNSFHPLFLNSVGKHQGANSKCNIHLRNTMF